MNDPLFQSSDQPVSDISQVVAVLGSPKTTLADLAAFGLTLDGGIAGSYFRWHGQTYVCGLPAWVAELIDLERARARESIRSEIRRALGLETTGTVTPANA